MYDADKENIFWSSDYKRMFGVESKTVPYDRQILQLEQQILLHPKNVQHLLMPLGNDIFVQGLYFNKFINNKWITPKQDTIFTIMEPLTNVNKAIIFVQGKFAVGIGAKSITFHVLNQVNNGTEPSINEFYLPNPSESTTRQTTLLFESLTKGNYFGNYVDSDLNLVSEIMSQLLTMYVDGVKDPYAVLMNITLQTANVVDYLIKSGLSAEEITLFLSQPFIKKYLTEQKINESLFNKNRMVPYTDMFGRVKGYMTAEKRKDDLIRDLFGELPEYPEDFKITKKNLVEGFTNNDNQVYFLKQFLEIQDLSKAYGTFLKTQDSDTGKFADRQDIVDDNQARVTVEKQQLVTPDTVFNFDNNGIVSPFYKYGRRSYNDLFQNIYGFNENTTFGQLLLRFKTILTEKRDSETSTKIMSTIDNDFITFLVQNLIFDQNEADRLLKGNSVAKRLKVLKDQIPENLFVKGTLPLLGNQEDHLTKEKIDNIRLFEKRLDGISTQNIMESFEEIYEIDEDLYFDLIKVLYYQNGLNQGILNYFNIIPVSKNNVQSHLYFTQQIIEDVQQKVKQIPTDEKVELFKKFMLLFDLNNPQFLQK